MAAAEHSAGPGAESIGGREGEDGSDERDPPVGDTGGEGADGPARARDWAGGGRLGRVRKEKKERTGPGWRFGLKGEREGERRERFFFLFAEDFKQIQFESKFEEFKFKLNHNIKTMQG